MFTDVIAQAAERLTVPRFGVDDHADNDVRAISALLELFDADSPTAKADLEFMNEIRARRAGAFLAEADHDAGRKAAAEVTTEEDIARLSRIIRARGDIVAAIVDTFQDIREDYRLGHRCSVCGLTRAQANAQNYDCVREC